MAKQYFVSPANSVLLQVFKTIWHTTKHCKWFELSFDVTLYSKDTDNSIAHKYLRLVDSICTSTQALEKSYSSFVTCITLQTWVLQID